jgi:hypothetical protein
VEDVVRGAKVAGSGNPYPEPEFVPYRHPGWHPGMAADPPRPPRTPNTTAAVERKQKDRDARFARWCELIEKEKMTVAEAVKVMKIGTSTGWAYEAVRKRQQAERKQQEARP